MEQGELESSRREYFVLQVYNVLGKDCRYIFTMARSSAEALNLEQVNRFKVFGLRNLNKFVRLLKKKKKK